MMSPQRSLESYLRQRSENDKYSHFRHTECMMSPILSEGVYKSNERTHKQNDPQVE